MLGTVTTEPNLSGRYRGLKPFQPGKSGNPAGRPKGSRHALSEAFVKALHDDFEAHGKEAIQCARERDPSRYLALVAAIVEKTLGAPALGEDAFVAVLTMLSRGARCEIKAGHSSE